MAAAAAGGQVFQSRRTVLDDILQRYYIRSPSLFDMEMNQAQIRKNFVNARNELFERIRRMADYSGENVEGRQNHVWPILILYVICINALKQFGTRASIEDFKRQINALIDEAAAVQANLRTPAVFGGNIEETIRNRAAIGDVNSHEYRRLLAILDDSSKLSAAEWDTVFAYRADQSNRSRGVYRDLLEINAQRKGINISSRSGIPNYAKKSSEKVEKEEEKGAAGVDGSNKRKNASRRNGKCSAAGSAAAAAGGCGVSSSRQDTKNLGEGARTSFGGFGTKESHNRLFSLAKETLLTQAKQAENERREIKIGVKIFQRKYEDFLIQVNSYETTKEQNQYILDFMKKIKTQYNLFMNDIPDADLKNSFEKEPISLEKYLEIKRRAQDKKKTKVIPNEVLELIVLKSVSEINNALKSVNVHIINLKSFLKSIENIKIAEEDVKLLAMRREGKITEEQYREIAAEINSRKDPEKVKKSLQESSEYFQAQLQMIAEAEAVEAEEAAEATGGEKKNNSNGKSTRRRKGRRGPIASRKHRR